MNEDIKASDLMIGNLVRLYRRPKDQEMTIHSIKSIFHNDDENIYFVEIEDGFIVNIKGISSILLTEDILIKAGFGLFNNGVFARKDLDRPALLMFSYSVNRKNIYCEIMGWRIECKYLHQLQNLFKALTGNDLKIEE